MRAAKVTKPAADSANGLRATCSAGGLNDREAKPSHNTTQVISAELIGSNQASAAGIVAIGHAPVSKLCRRLIEAGHNPDLPLEVYRGTTLCLRVRSIDKGAALSVEDDENGRPRFVRHRPRTCGAAPYVAQAVRPVP